jgi:hypothetical protein
VHAWAATTYDRGVKAQKTFFSIFSALFAARAAIQRLFWAVLQQPTSPILECDARLSTDFVFGSSDKKHRVAIHRPETAVEGLSH